MRRDVARVFGGIVDANHLPRFDRGAGDSLSDRNIIDVDALVVADAEQMLQRFPAVIHQQDTERVVVNQLAHGLDDRRERLVPGEVIQGSGHGVRWDERGGDVRDKHKHHGERGGRLGAASQETDGGGQPGQGQDE